MRETYLVCCEANDNHNKYYKMIPSADGNTFTVEFGRVGASCQKAEYSIKLWDKKYKEKIKKGYKDMSDLRDVPLANEAKDFSDIEDNTIRALLEELRGYANNVIKTNYIVEAGAVTPAMVDAVKVKLSEIEEIYNNLSSGSSTSGVFIKLPMSYAEYSGIVKTVNNLLQEIFTVIPRKMANVKSNLMPDEKRIRETDGLTYVESANIIKLGELIQKERDLIDTMAVISQQTSNDKAVTLESLGLEIKPCTNKDIEVIKRELGDCANLFESAWCVKHIASAKAFDKFKKNNIGTYKRFPTKLLWHGSRNENWWSILNNSLKLNPVGAKINGKAFGAGLYFASKARKSLGYTSLNGYWTRENKPCGYVALYNTAYGKPYNVTNNSEFKSSFGWKNLKKLDSEAHCVHAHAGERLLNDEIIYYDESQVTIKYIVKLRK